MMQKMTFLCATLLLLAVAVIGTAGASILDTGFDHVIHATGTGSVIGTPDRAQVSLAIQTENPDVKLAQQENAAKMDAVLNALVASGIPPDALKTTGYNLYPVYEESKALPDQKIRTYRVTNTVTVTLHDVNRTGEVIDIAVANGINEASSIRFMLSDEQAQVLRTGALKEAVARARADAETVTGALGIGLASVKNVEIGGGYSPVLYENYAMAGDLKSAAVPTPIQPGDVTVTASVTISYLIR